ncbi:hypothetical protein HanXRQr2_Chr01g0016671 [Helianthus annuus]|uniref:Uncharacterized protein n=1 Tax=Helianthus annuus TaxID=4232 RepID=A0A9K3JTY3_HELAN|nr:hypothetical protein HanXRQr2_Chr01g0016671 [Helianthus annuus]KAJ0956548.1 hypothetical protein HanPSC8_Chr01g0016081 [Helianthus annuus]
MEKLVRSPEVKWAFAPAKKAANNINVNTAAHRHIRTYPSAICFCVYEITD